MISGFRDKKNENRHSSPNVMSKRTRKVPNSTQKEEIVLEFSGKDRNKSSSNIKADE